MVDLVCCLSVCDKKLVCSSPIPHPKDTFHFSTSDYSGCGIFGVVCCSNHRVFTMVYRCCHGFDPISWYRDFLRTHPLNGKLKILTLLVSILLWMICLHNGIQIELATRSYPYGILSIVCAIAGSLVMMGISQGIERIPVLSDFLIWAGKNSIVILAVHCLEMRFFQWQEWVYEPLHISPGWKTDCIIHTTMILLITWSYTVIQNIIKQRNSL